MSYAFSVVAPNKAEAMEKVISELDKVVHSQPCHAADRAQAQAATQAFLDIIPEADEHQDVRISVNGSVCWNGDGVTTSASVGVSAWLVQKESA